MPAPIRNRLTPAIAAALAAVALSPSAPAQPPASAAAGQEPTTLDRIQVTGSRVRGRTAEDTAAPVDVIGREELNATGALEVGQILQMLEPSFNFSRTFVSDGTDILRPATLRALGPDQVLVLVNGKRRHQQALVNVQQTIGRGSAGTDINAIPVAAIERIEVLRDGAAAQYGSDAIAGVINIILKKQTDHTEVSVEGAQYYAGDGEMLHGSVNTGFALGGEGFLNLTAEARNRNETNRAGPDRLRVDPPRVTQRLGDADARDHYLWFNGGLPAGAGELYWFGGVSRREGDSSGFFRSAGDNRTVPALYPDGFLPNILTTVEDASVAVGYRAPLGDRWDWDVSINRGRNKFGFEESNSVNVSWWYEPRDPADPAAGIYAESPTSADTGTLRFDQTTFNLDFNGSVDGWGGNPLYLATGFEWRQDDYRIEAGDPVSYTYGRTNDRGIPIVGQAGEIAQPGIQGFPGFSPSEAVDDGRHSMAVYLDAETHLGERLLIGAAVRFEDYSDFGNTTTGKLSARFDASERFAVRGTLATGFRAPGVQQLFYSQRSTNLNAEGVLTDTLTARQDSAVTRAFGIEPLQEETSTSGTLGFVWKPNERFSATLDVFRIDIDDRIIFSSNIQPESVGTDGNPCAADLANCPIRAILDPIGVGQVLFFTNAIDTRTTGVDLVLNHGTEFAAGSRLDLTALVHFNKTEVEARRSQSPILPPAALFDDAQVTLVEQGQPRAHHVLQAVYETGPWQITGRGNYYGSVAGEGFTPGLKQTWDGKWLFDLGVRYAFSENLALTVGGNNLFDEYPDEWTVGADDPGVNPFPSLGFKYGWETMPFGMNGGSYYARLDYRF
ncbi:TonB-dependent receptor plug domain-containing protein [Vulcaniibacterium tengchongense]|uniref:Iron complex outermembrane receptor protein n=1 Tax=Vulcaniibacterium tengchongense TaxID=1273429 RepID=A0A3N4VQ56_9GAMM|nr:TonB-dependent receptor [Vulcaniibacterium tengchongense]RPE75940.1 iron complex outermembrane receptor protein [Vulcaniibacterium tengchongense]